MLILLEQNAGNAVSALCVFFYCWCLLVSAWWNTICAVKALNNRCTTICNVLIKIFVWDSLQTTLLRTKSSWHCFGLQRSSEKRQFKQWWTSNLIGASFCWTQHKFLKALLNQWACNSSQQQRCCCRRCSWGCLGLCHCCDSHAHSSPGPSSGQGSSCSSCCSSAPWAGCGPN